MPWKRNPEVCDAKTSLPYSIARTQNGTGMKHESGKNNLSSAKGVLKVNNETYVLRSFLF